MTCATQMRKTLRPEDLIVLSQAVLEEEGLGLDPERVAPLYQCTHVLHSSIVVDQVAVRPGAVQLERALIAQQAIAAPKATDHLAGVVDPPPLSSSCYSIVHRPVMDALHPRAEHLGAPPDLAHDNLLDPTHP